MRWVTIGGKSLASVQELEAHVVRNCVPASGTFHFAACSFGSGRRPERYSNRMTKGSNGVRPFLHSSKNAHVASKISGTGSSSCSSVSTSFMPCWAAVNTGVSGCWNEVLAWSVVTRNPVLPSWSSTVMRRSARRPDPILLVVFRTAFARAASLPRSRVMRMQNRSASPTSYVLRTMASYVCECPMLVAMEDESS